MISPHFDSDSIFVPFPRSINLPQGVPDFPLFMLTRTEVEERPTWLKIVDDDNDDYDYSPSIHRQ